MLNKLILFSILILQAAGLVAQDANKSFLLDGRIDEPQTGWLYLYYTTSDGTRIRDSAAIVNGRFSFRGRISEPVMAFLQLKEEKRNEAHAASFFLEPVKMNFLVRGQDFRQALISGSSTQKELEELNRMKEPVRKEMEGLSSLYSKKGEEYRLAVKNRMDDRILDSLKEDLARVQQGFEPFSRRMNQMDHDFFIRHPQSYVTAYNMRFHVSRLSLDSLQAVYDRLGSRIQQSLYGKELGEEIRKLKNGSPGSMAGDFASTDINGQPLQLSGYRSKYVLLDFWASWCVPCRKGNPHLKELYAKYKDRGIEFIGISDDDSNPDAWRKAVQKDGLPWKHVLRGLKRTPEGFDRSNDISELYGIHTLPTKILIDPHGVIIGRYDENEEALDAKLKEIFGE